VAYKLPAFLYAGGEKRRVIKVPVIRFTNPPTMVDVTVLRDPKLNALDKAVYSILCSYETHPVCHEVTVDILIQLTKASNAQMTKTLKRLEARELIRDGEKLGRT